jgi:predicted ATPase
METYCTVGTQNRGQIFVTTHSPTLMDLFSPKDIIWARFRDGVTTSGRIGKRQMEVVRRQLFSVGELIIAEGLS